MPQHNDEPLDDYLNRIADIVYEREPKLPEVTEEPGPDEPEE